MHKQILCFAFSAAFSVGMAMAAPQDDQAPPPQQGPGGRRGMAMDPDQQVKMMTKRLKLTDDQASQIRPILADRQQQMQALRADTATAPQDRMAKAKSIRDDGDMKIKAILNDSQKAQYEQMQQQGRERMRERMQQRNGAGDAGSAPPPAAANQ